VERVRGGGTRGGIEVDWVGKGCGRYICYEMFGKSDVA